MSVFIYIVFLNIYLLYSGVQADIGNDCQLKSTNSSGQCTLLKSCPVAVKEIQEGKNPQICRFQGKEPIVCCAVSNPTNVETPSPQEEPERISTKKCREYAQLGIQYEDYASLIDSAALPVKTCPFSSTPLIIGGSHALPKEFPHMALLGFGPQDDIQWLCSGALISEQFVLTAAHCLVTPQYGEVQWIRLGDLDDTTSKDDAQTQQFSVMERIRHPQFAYRSRYHDIGLIKMNRVVPFTKYVRPACLYSGNPALQDKQRFISTGWDLNWERKERGALEKMVLEAVTQDTCNASYAKYINRRLKFGILPDSQLCAGNKDSGIRFCQGNSGGPLVMFSNEECMYDVVGVSSFSTACGVTDIPEVFSRVSHYVDWIEKTVWP